MELKGCKILVVDDEENIRDILQAAFEASGAKVFNAPHAEVGLELVREENLDLVVSDVRMPGMDGLAFLAVVREEQPSLPFLLITAHGSMDMVVQALRLGAGDFLSKPFDIKHVRQVAAGLIARTSSRVAGIHLAGASGTVHGANNGVIGLSAPFVAAKSMASKAARTDSSVLILGESGTGKEVLARLVHSESTREAKAFIAVNCGAIPENLMESELFGHEKGSFTGAMQEKPGKIELAEGGTLFLDEIGELPLQLQVKLLRVLQQKVVDRVGSSKGRPVDFRLVAATNRDLQKEIAAGRFREDLYYRLNVIPIVLPPLRERGDDIRLLAVHFLEMLNQRYGSSFTLTTSQILQLSSYPWLGNIRELENILERSVVLSAENHLELHLPQQHLVREVQGSLHGQKREAERDAIAAALAQCHGNKSHAAKHLGISRRGLLYKIKEFGMGEY